MRTLSRARFLRAIFILAFCGSLSATAGADTPAPAAGARPSSGKGRLDTEVRRLDLLIVLYTQSFSQALSRVQLERVHEEVLEFIDFYRRSAGDAVEFRVSLLQIDRELALDEASQVAPGRYYLAREDIEAELTALGMLDYEYDEVIALYAWNNANPEGAALAYGGGAVGPDGRFLGDAGYNSIGVFAWDPGRISQIMIHEVLHNLDDMFSRSGMPGGFLNADEMSRNMSTLLAERPGAFLPHYADDEMISYAERELANRATYPWSMQLVYYNWMLQRTPRAAWLRLDYGEVVEAEPEGQGTHPLYDRLFISRANDEVYVPVIGGHDGAVPTVRIGEHRQGLTEHSFEHTDFDGRTLFAGRYFAGWVPLPEGNERLTLHFDAAEAEVIRLGMGEISAPARVVSYRSPGELAPELPASGDDRLLVSLGEAKFGPGGPLVTSADATVTAVLPDGTEALRELEPGRFGLPLGALPVGEHELEVRAEAEGLVFVPRTVQVERRSPWRITSEERIVTGNGLPLAVTVRVARDVGLNGARVVARVGGRKLRLDELADGRYSGVLQTGLRPGLDTVRVGVELPGAVGAGTLDRAIPVYAEPRGWIEAPPQIAVSAGQMVALEARVRDRMGKLVRGANLPIAAVVGDELLMMKEDPAGGVYSVRFAPPPGEHRIYVIGLEGSYERRVVSLQVQ